MSNFRIEHDKTRLEVEWDIDNGREAGVYVLVHDDLALTNQLTIMIGDRVVHNSEHVEATGCIRLSLEEAQRTRDALDQAIVDARSFLAHDCDDPDCQRCHHAEVQP